MKLQLNGYSPLTGLLPDQAIISMCCCQIRSGRPGYEDPYLFLAVDSMGLMPVLK